MTERRFPPPWSVEQLDACFIVRDHNGQALAYVYFLYKGDSDIVVSTARLIGGHRSHELICSRLNQTGFRI